ncbi:hypothetical protein EUGRSUZ_D02576 [Eucalyptus grandis]|uniref:Uncharacterized protein n=2 Tax=Eucalyptus grandis TaxID=71139 RepID=A0ACC3L8C4_EUCGR|nr:hypothetical protein EUGRSUZ_D02576 [Eucalyptus grandis]
MGSRLVKASGAAISANQVVKNRGQRQRNWRGQAASWLTAVASLAKGWLRKRLRSNVARHGWATAFVPFVEPR